MLARYMLCPRVCVSVFVTSWSSTKTVQWIELIFGTEASFNPSYTVLTVLERNLGTSLWDFVHKLVSAVADGPRYARPITGTLSVGPKAQTGRGFVCCAWEVY